MDTRTKRFVAAVAYCEWLVPETVSPRVQGWTFYERAHPLDGHPMALAQGALTAPAIQDPPYRIGGPDLQAKLCLTAVRTGRAASSIEASVGIDVTHAMGRENRAGVVDGPILGGFIPALETEPAYRDTCRARLAWSLAKTTALPGVEMFRGWPCTVKVDEHLIHFDREFPDGWGPRAPERSEAALSGATSPFAAADTLAIGVPWLSPHHELVWVFALANLHTALATVKRLVAPPPAPAESASE